MAMAANGARAVFGYWNDQSYRTLAFGSPKTFIRANACGSSQENGYLLHSKQGPMDSDVQQMIRLRSYSWLPCLP